MTLEEFSNYIKFKDRERELCQYFDEHLLLHSLLSDKFSNDLNVEMKTDKNGCYYTLTAINKADISYMVDFYNCVQLNFYSHKYIADISMSKNSVIIKFKIKGIAI